MGNNICHSLMDLSWLNHAHIARAPDLSKTINEVGWVRYRIRRQLQHLSPPVGGLFYANNQTVELCIIVLFFATLITTSGLSRTSNLHGKLFNYLGAISLPLSMWHYGVIRIMQALSINYGSRVNVLLLIATSILVSAIHYQIVQAISLKRQRRK